MKSENGGETDQPGVQSASSSVSSSERSPHLVETAQEEHHARTVSTELASRAAPEESLAPAISMTADQNDLSVIKHERPSGSVDSRQTSPMELHASVAGTPQPRKHAPICGSGKKRKASSSAAPTSAITSPRTKKAKVHPSVERDERIMSPVEDEEESLRLARALAQESFSLRRR